ncbi:MAG: CRISPR system precrRNA processing endoribonuclease RAMP protein Cas6 [Acidilobaceae archaeon]|nr:CRISPR system precrRNA processing endoribonuclease RAMP protein Cas6 [Acidilobaceae archaeon]MCX8165240.1 CRISPR system precrRNA processing endoribonuclease RAMP protein Cas6 [Acidilobaceae archaeon]MDW7973666.1 CRISPR system precrRNA processing endoribonuclease RAMP protein Cas6 [Sulfolobales archaeon]
MGTLREFFLSLIDGARGYVITTTLEFVPPEADVILPPFTSRVTKQAIFSGCLPQLAELMKGRKAMKEARVTALMRGNMALFSTGKMVIARAGERLEGRVAIYAEDPSEALEASMGCKGKVRIGSESLFFSVSRIDVEEVKRLSIGLEAGRPFKMSIRTPLLLPIELMTPPRLRGRKSIRELGQAYKLVPTPAYLLSAAAREWIAIVRGEQARESYMPYAVGRAADVFMYELNYKLKPVTALYRSRDGKLSKVRGPIGYVIYVLGSKRMERVTDRLLGFVARMGLGKSRSIGFGDVAFNVLEAREGADVPASPH